MDDYTALLTTIVPTTAEATRVRLGEEGVGWFSTPTSLTLKDDEGGHHIEPLTALGYVLPRHRLKQCRTYQLIGPLGIDSKTEEAFIKHTLDTRIEVGTHCPDLEALAGRSMLSGLGKVLNVTFDNVAIPRVWNLTVTAQHHCYDPVVQHAGSMAQYKGEIPSPKIS
ncbi:uncharacterized protein MELLADRAFT_107850 [Melampsora larici-populina 98AG31]|uniref:Uncharacterized protein n=1 Tax=Melampsora larici-populina (strain 98AG31 / pathotype 3-4-7) TaxID=747676 RepID=F4RIP3_MELLP|nr:uncharacterized protein MELLADRAFT_105577 [Melampsora larici-populina 98AG31]XP_007411518.1 uncharacterized protein MELLADRAFT_107850 [Melampsora larici-populina 98AG31]EGG05153.1 hypothetical protein MELLADRAFT_107850 [Melampsora larici-populina 98AG31]EGG07799.1 hypothetical protein MELLADRAFT_105577 [Melampsora larici-populina 98AG31]